MTEDDLYSHFEGGLHDYSHFAVCRQCGACVDLSTTSMTRHVEWHIEMAEASSRAALL